MPLPDDLLTPERELRETHTAWVFLDQERVYKVKKPVNLGFVDFSTLALRRVACEAELTLNQRLAGQTYERLAPVTRKADGHLELDGAGEIADWAVVMRRLPDAERADNLAAQGALGPAHVDAMARRIATFHDEAAAIPQAARYAAPDRLLQQVDDNLGGADEVLIKALGELRARSAAAWQRRFINDHQSVLQERIAAGRIRDCHGDLKLEHFYLTADHQVTVLDCVEFNPSFRAIDTVMDLAFLSMDLRAQGQELLAERLLSTYAQHTLDYDLFRLVDFCESFRACVKAKTSFLLARGSHSRQQNESALAAADRYAHLALAVESPPFTPAKLVLVFGCIGSGKTTLASRLSLELGGVHLSSDHTRKHLAGASPTTPLEAAPFCAAYSSDRSAQVYDHLARAATTCLGASRSVVVDASFRRREDRERFAALAAQDGVPFYAFECWADRDTLLERLRRRALQPSVSDGRAELLASFLDHFEWPTVDELPHWHRIDTRSALEAQLALASEALATT